MTKIMYLVAATAMIAAPAAAQNQPASSVQATDSSTKSDVNKLVCKKETPLGSRIGAKKVCLTVKEWKDRADADRDETENIQRSTFTDRSG